MKELIGDILSTVNFKSVVYFKYGFCSPWGMDVASGDFAQFHFVANGSCMLYVDQEYITLERGDLVIFPNGFPHQIKHDQSSICKSGQEVVTAVLNNQQPFDGAHPSTHLVCGHYEMDRALSHPILDKLPDYILIKNNEYGRFDLINTILELIVDELNIKKAGYQIISVRFAEILFISILRHYYLNQKDTGNIFKDHSIYKVVDYIHREIHSDLSIKILYRQVGLSRTLFIERFKNAVGETPLKYIQNWRITKAKKLLKETNLSLLEIGERVGYSSATSFNRVFKQNCNISPNKFRKEN